MPDLSCLIRLLSSRHRTHDRGGRHRWSREDVLIAYALYCVTPFNRITPANPVIRQVAEKQGLSLASLVMRMKNFQGLEGKGLSHVAKLDKELYEEFCHDWGELAFEAEKITGLALFDGDPEHGAKPISSLTDHRKVSRERHFFRVSIFAAYNNECCITRLALPALLVASHIKPYNKCKGSGERTDPHNGLLLNNFYDKAFDQGLITIDRSYEIKVSPVVKRESHNEFTRQWLIGLEGNKIILPRDFYPSQDAIEYHNDVIFKR